MPSREEIWEQRRRQFLERQKATTSSKGKSDALEEANITNQIPLRSVTARDEVVPALKKSSFQPSQPQICQEQNKVATDIATEIKNTLSSGHNLNDSPTYNGGIWKLQSQGQNILSTRSPVEDEQKSLSNAGSLAKRYQSPPTRRDRAFELVNKSNDNFVSTSDRYERRMNSLNIPGQQVWGSPIAGENRNYSARSNKMTADEYRAVLSKQIEDKKSRKKAIDSQQVRATGLWLFESETKSAEKKKKQADEYRAYLERQMEEIKIKKNRAKESYANFGGYGLKLGDRKTNKIRAQAHYRHQLDDQVRVTQQKKLKEERKESGFFPPIIKEDKRSKQEEFRRFLDEQVQRKRRDKNRWNEWSATSASSSQSHERNLTRDKQNKLRNFLDDQVRIKEQNEKIVKEEEQLSWNREHSRATPAISEDFQVIDHEEKMSREKELIEQRKQEEYRRFLDAQIKLKSVARRKFTNSPILSPIENRNIRHVSPPKPSNRFVGVSEEELVRKKHEQEAYRRALEQQVAERKMRRKKIVEEKEQEEERVYKEVPAIWSSHGGGGAPIKDAKGNIITQLRNKNPLSTPRIMVASPTKATPQSSHKKFVNYNPTKPPALSFGEIEALEKEQARQKQLKYRQELEEQAKAQRELSQAKKQKEKEKEEKERIRIEKELAELKERYQRERNIEAPIHLAAGGIAESNFPSVTIKVNSPIKKKKQLDQTIPERNQSKPDDIVTQTRKKSVASEPDDRPQSFDRVQQPNRVIHPRSTDRSEDTSGSPQFSRNNNESDINNRYVPKLPLENDARSRYTPERRQSKLHYRSRRASPASSRDSRSNSRYRDNRKYMMDEESVRSPASPRHRRSKSWRYRDERKDMMDEETVRRVVSEEMRQYAPHPGWYNYQPMYHIPQIPQPYITQNPIENRRQEEFSKNHYNVQNYAVPKNQLPLPSVIPPYHQSEPIYNNFMSSPPNNPSVEGENSSLKPLSVLSTNLIPIEEDVPFFSSSSETQQIADTNCRRILTQNPRVEDNASRNLKSSSSLNNPNSLRSDADIINRFLHDRPISTPQSVGGPALSRPNTASSVNNSSPFSTTKSNRGLSMLKLQTISSPPSTGNNYQQYSLPANSCRLKTPVYSPSGSLRTASNIFSRNRADCISDTPLSRFTNLKENDSLLLDESFARENKKDVDDDMKKLRNLIDEEFGSDRKYLKPELTFDKKVIPADNCSDHKSIGAYSGFSELEFSSDSGNFVVHTTN